MNCLLYKLVIYGFVDQDRGPVGERGQNYLPGIPKSSRCKSKSAGLS